MTTVAVNNIPDADEPTLLPAHWEICGCCSGNGTTSRYMGSWTQSEWADEDPDFKEDYLAGNYDRPCEECKGLGRVAVVTEEACTTPEQKAALKFMRDEAEWRAEAAAERKREMLMLGEARLEDFY